MILCFLFLSDVDKLIEGLKELLLTGKFSDVILNVKGEKFRVHKNILSIHSPVFASMMEHDSQEHDNGTVNIDSSEPNTFTDFLHFLYYGGTQNINLENVVDLYILGDKYQVIELNKVCVIFMMNHISLETFCDIMSLAIRFHEKELSEVTTEYFLKYWTDVSKTAKWLIFLKENSSAGNDLFLKALSLKI